MRGERAIALKMNPARISTFDSKLRKLVFEGTSVPVDAVFDYVDCGDDEDYEIRRFLEAYPEVSREQLEEWLTSSEEQRLYAIEGGAAALNFSALLLRGGIEKFPGATAFIALSSLSLAVVACGFPIWTAAGLPWAPGAMLTMAGAGAAIGFHSSAKRSFEARILQDRELAAFAEQNGLLEFGGGDAPRGIEQRIAYRLLIIGLATLSIVVGLIVR